MIDPLEWLVSEKAFPIHEEGMDAIDYLMSEEAFPIHDEASEDDEPEQKNCGTGAGGFQPGNECGRGDGAEGEGSKPSSSESDVTVEERADAEAISVAKEIAGGVNMTDIRELRKHQGFHPFDAADGAKLRNDLGIYEMEGYVLFTEEGAPDWADAADSRVGTWAEKRGKFFSQFEIDAEPDEGKAKKMAAKNQRVFERVVQEAKERMETALAESELFQSPPLYRGISMTPEDLDEMVKSGFVSHERTNSWTANTAVASNFADGPFGRKVILVAKNPAKGYINKNGREMEVIRPPSSMKIARVIRTKDGAVVELEEDENYREEDEQ